MIVNRRLLAIAGEIRWYLTSAVAVRLAITTAYIFQGILIARVVAGIFRGEPLDELTALLAGVAVAILARGALIWLGELAAQRTAHAVKERLRERLYRKLLEIGPGAVLRHRTGHLKATLVDSVEALEAYYSHYLPAVAVVLVAPAALLIYLGTLDLPLALILAVFAVATPVLPVLWLRIRATKSAGIFAAIGSFSADFLDSLQGMTTLKAFNATARRRAQLAVKADRLRRGSMDTLKVNLLLGGVTTLCTVGGTTLAVAYGSVRVAEGALAPVALFTVLFLVREVFRPFDEMSRQFHSAYTATSAVARVDELLAAAPPAPEPAAPVAVDRATEPSVAFEDVTFAYDPQSPPALRDLTLTVEPGETVAVVGRSGAGKSTIVSLLLRFFDPQQGRIRLGGHDLRTLPTDAVRGMIAVVSQDTYLFHGTIAENIALAKPEATDEEIVAAARAANAHQFIAELPDGYDTQVGERGLQLSGGQRQRIAIARALLKDAPILVLDEATSSVDAAAEAAIQEALDGLTRDRTTIVIAHRLSTVRDADRIVVLAEGAAVESGAHGDLLDRRGEYAQLVTAQEAI